jgi:hypothetical protein
MPNPSIEPNIFPGNWTVKTQRLLRTYEQAFVQDWSPVVLSWNSLDPSGLELEERVAQAWYRPPCHSGNKPGRGSSRC